MFLRMAFLFCFIHTTLQNFYHVLKQWNLSSGLSIRMSSVREGLSSAEICGKEGLVLQIQTSAVFGVKNFGFFEISGVYSTYRQNGGDQFFTILCGRLL